MTDEEYYAALAQKEEYGVEGDDDVTAGKLDAVEEDAVGVMGSIPGTDEPIPNIEEGLLASTGWSDPTTPHPRDMVDPTFTEDAFDEAMGEEELMESDSKLEDVLMVVENDAKKGFNKKTGLWAPHTSKEGGRDTIGYGHKLTPDEEKSGVIIINGDEYSISKGIPEEAMGKLLRQDIKIAKDYLKDNFVGWDKLSERDKGILVNIGFNVGNKKVKIFKNLRKAMDRGDEKAIQEEMVTSYEDKYKKRHKLKSRARKVYKALT